MKWLEGKKVRITIQCVTSAGTAIFGALLGNSEHIRFIIFLILLIICIATGVVYNFWLVSVDNSRTMEVHKVIKKMEVYKDLFSAFPDEFQDDAEGLNKIAHAIHEKGAVPGERWTFEQA